MEYIKIKDWGKTQHYKKRRPPWIRLYTYILDKYDDDGKPKKFYKLPDDAKLTFIMLLCASSRFNNNIPFDNASELASILAIKTVNLQPLLEADYIQIVNDASIDDSNMLAPETETETETETDISVFEQFWKLYPKKVGKGQAEKAWKKIKKPTETLQNIKVALDWQKKSEQWTKENGQYIPHPATYLNQRRWEDEKPILQDNIKQVCKYCKEEKSLMKFPDLCLECYMEGKR